MFPKVSAITIILTFQGNCADLHCWKKSMLRTILSRKLLKLKFSCHTMGTLTRQRSFPLTIFDYSVYLLVELKENMPRQKIKFYQSAKFILFS
jgi:hypothetical protein